jgi:hypothetical protein
MANHTGYIFVAPNGAYIAELPGPPGLSRTFILTHLLDAAQLFPTTGLPSHSADYSRVTCTLRELGFTEDYQKLLIPLEARSIQRIEIGNFA